MHHYPFHVGDYTLATLHLEDRQDLCYRRLLDAYYLDAAPLADAKQTLSRRVRTDEQTLTEVLTEFFELVDGFWHHARCDREIARYKAKSDKAKIAGSLGGKAKSATPNERQANAKRTPSKRLANQNQNQNQNQSIPSASPPGSDAEAKPDERHTAFIRAFTEAYETEAGTKYLFQTRDAKTLKTFLQASTATVDQMMTLLRWSWERSKQPFAAKHHSAATIHDFLTNWQKLVMDRRQPQGAAPNRHAAYTPENAMAKLKPGQSPQDF